MKEYPRNLINGAPHVPGTAISSIPYNKFGCSRLQFKTTYQDIHKISTNTFIIGAENHGHYKLEMESLTHTTMNSFKVNASGFRRVYF